MIFIPLNQHESVELVIHALRAAGGEADCSVCPARRVCMKQCLTIAAAVQEMVSSGTLPSLAAGPEPPDDAPPAPGGGGRGRLTVIK
jgi:hypothetical protein